MSRKTVVGYFGTRPAGTRAAKDWVLWGALGCVLVGTAHAEYTLAVATGINQWVAASVPGALDLYVIRALQVRRDVFLAVLAMVAVNVVSHLVSAGELRVDWRIISAVGALAPLILWRIHSLWYQRSRTRSEILWDAPAPAEGTPGTQVPEPGTPPDPDDVDVPEFMREAKVPEYAMCRVCGQYFDIETQYPQHILACVPGEVPEEDEYPELPEYDDLEPDESLFHTMRALYEHWNGRPPGPGIKAIRTACKVGQSRAQELQVRFDREFSIVRTPRTRKEGTQ